MIRAKDKILFDLDDVVFPCIDALCMWYNTTYPQYDPISEDSFSEWDMSKATPLGKDIYSFFKTDMYEGAIPTPGFNELCHLLRTYYSAEVWIVTATLNEQSARRFVEKRLHVDNFVYSEDKTQVRGRYLIDDKPKTLAAGVAMRDDPPWTPILYHRAHNQTERSFVRAYNMHHVGQILGVY